MIRRILPRIASAFILIFGLQLAAQIPASWTTPVPPFRIVGNLYYVGSQDLAAYLIVTPQGNILINSNLQSSPPQIRKSIESLGFIYSDTKILLISHGHYDHCAGSAEIKRETGAKYEVMAQDVPVVQSGGQNDFHYASDKTFGFRRRKSTASCTMAKPCCWAAPHSPRISPPVTPRALPPGHSTRRRMAACCTS